MIAAINTTSLGGFLVIMAIVAAISLWASRRNKSTSDFLAAKGSLTAGQNGWAIAGDYLSSASLLGGVGLMFLGGLDGMYIAASTVMGFVLVLLLIAERMRNAGKFTIGDVLAQRLNQRPVRTAVGVSALAVSIVYLLSVLVGGGVVIRALLGFSYPASVLLTMGLMLGFVLLGGMLGASYVQIFKAFILVTLVATMVIWVLGKSDFSLNQLFTRAAERHPAGQGFLNSGLLFKDDIDTISLFMAFTFGVAGLPHVLIRFFTVPNAVAARRSLGYGLTIVTSVLLVTTILGAGARALLPAVDLARIDPGGNLAVPVLAQFLGGGEGSTGGDLFLAIFSGVAVATILAVVAGIIIASAGTIAHDLWRNVVRGGRMSDREEFVVARIGAAVVAVVATVLAIAAGEGFNTALLVALGFSIAAASNVPALILTLTWPRFNTTGAVTGIVVGMVSAVALIVLSPPVWPGPASAGSPIELTNPAIIAMPLGFLGCYVGTLLSRRREAGYEELLVRQHTGLGAA
jgi:cation/acetate symporter